jgi:hypothetical protein
MPMPYYASWKRAIPSRTAYPERINQKTGDDNTKIKPYAVLKLPVKPVML